MSAKKTNRGIHFVEGETSESESVGDVREGEPLTTLEPNICPTCGKVIPRVRRENLEPIVAAQYCHCPPTNFAERASASAPVPTDQEVKSA